MSTHTHADARPTFGCDACIEAMHHPKIIDDGLSATQRLTARNKADLARGVHPATRRPLADNDETCGTCLHHHDYLYHSRRYHKCELHHLGESHSEASDIRVSWPACTKWECEVTHS